MSASPRKIIGALGLLALIVATPAAAQPSEGGFAGMTSQGWQYNVTVGSAGKSLSYLYLDAKIANCLWYYYNGTGSIAVTGGQFSDTYHSGDGCFNVTTSGTFTSPSTASGTFSASIPAGCDCAGSTTGTWVAYGPPASLCPAGSAARSLFFDNFENPSSGWWTNPVMSGVNHWNGCTGSPAIYCSNSPKSGFYNLFGRDVPSAGDSAAAMSPVARTPLPAGARMQFDHYFEFEYGWAGTTLTPRYFDAGVLEYSVNGGTTWLDAGSLIETGPRYLAKIPAGFGNPLAGRSAFVGFSPGYTASQLNLSSLAGKAVQLRFRVGTDTEANWNGWRIDNVNLYSCVAVPVAITDDACAEGDSGSSSCYFWVTLGSGVSEDIAVGYEVVDGTAKAGTDYVASSGTLVIPAGSLSVPLTVSLIGDTVDEDDETFVVRLTSAPKATITHGEAIGTILDDDPTPSLEIAGATVTEPDTGTTPMNFAVSLSAPSGRAVRFRATTADGTATAGSDYEAFSDVMEIIPGQTGGVVSVPILGDRIAEATEDFSVGLTEPVNVTFASSVATGTILDSDPPGLSVSDVTVVEPRTGTRDAVFTVTITPAPAGTVTVDYATVDGTATSPADYAAASGQLTFDPANLTRTVNVAVNADSLTEHSEEFTLQLSNPSGGTPLVSGGVGTGRILDPGNFHTLKPCRAVDTRNTAGPLGGPALMAGAERAFALENVCGVPPGAAALSVNVAVTAPTVAGNLRLYPTGVTPPVVSTINYSAGQTRANNAVVSLGSGAQVTVKCAQASGTAHFILDVNGYFE